MTTTIQQSNSGKHIPQRTCIACREIKPKRQLIRIVSTPDGKAELDISGKKTGRGAYLCRSSLCWEKALKKGLLEKALRRKITNDNEIRLVEVDNMI